MRISLKGKYLIIPKPSVMYKKIRLRNFNKDYGYLNTRRFWFIQLTDKQYEFWLNILNNYE